MYEAVALSVVLPAYNEEASLPEAFEQCRRLVDLLPGKIEVIVVDDGSEDSTPTVIEKACDELPWLTLVRHDSNLGYGRAIRSGFAKAYTLSLHDALLI